MSDRVSNVLHVNCREDIAATKREILSASEHQSHAPAISAPGMSISGMGGLCTCLHFPQFAGHFQPVYPDTAVLSSVLTAAVTRALPRYVRIGRTIKFRDHTSKLTPAYSRQA